MAKVEITMPKMGESITEGTVLEWHKQPGDAIEVDEILLEIGTDKVDTEVPSPAGGVLAEILVPEGETVEVGTVIAMVETDAAAAGDGAATAPPAADAEPAPAAPAPEPEPTPAADPEPAPAAAPAASGDLTDVVMPKMGESIMEGTILTWHKQPGDEIELDETLLEIATDKVDTEVPSPAGGVLAEILVEEGATVEVGTVIARIGSEAGATGASAPAAAPSQPAAQAAPTPEPAVEGYGTAGQNLPQAAAAVQGDDRPIERTGADGRFFSPLVRSIAEAEGLSMGELEQVPGTGRDGRVTKDDLMGYLKNRGSQPAAPAPLPQRPAKAPAVKPMPTPVFADASGRVEILEMDRMRQIIAEHMVRSKATSAHVTSFAEIDVTNLVRARESNKEAFFQREGVRLTYTPFFVQAAVEALREHPILNASVEGKQIHLKRDYHIGIAVAIGKTGLLAPVIRDAGQKNLVGLAHAAADLAARARNKELMPDQLQGGTFTVTNIGSLGSVMGTPIINQPQVGILATGAIKKRPVVVEHPDLGDLIAVRHMMFVSLSYDHRVVDGAMASSFLHKYTQVLEGYEPDMVL